VVEEANAIETVDQRAQMLPDPFRTRILGLLREYVDARIELRANGMSRECRHPPHAPNSCRARCGRKTLR